MITSYFNPNEISKECLKIINAGSNPVIYTSSNNLNVMIPPIGLKDKDEYTNYEIGNELGYVGRYRGCPVYATNSVGNLWVIVPQFKEK